MQKESLKILLKALGEEVKFENKVANFLEKEIIDGFFVKRVNPLMEGAFNVIESEHGEVVSDIVRDWLFDITPMSNDKKFNSIDDILDFVYATTPENEWELK